MTGSQFETRRLLHVPQTPIHVGGGEEARILPEGYRRREGRAERISVRAILARMAAEDRRRWLADTSRSEGSMGDALRRLQDRAAAEDILERIDIGSDAEGALDPRGEGKDRQNLIQAFSRAGGRPTLAGSSVKGMLRAAWLAALAALDDPPGLPPIGEWRTLGPRDRARATAAGTARLPGPAGGGREQDTDPFRDVTFADAVLPAGATRIDAVRAWKRGPPARGPAGACGFESRGQMHRERLRSAADGGAPPLVELTVGLRAADGRGRAGRLGPDRRTDARRTPAGLPDLLRALEDHHGPLWRREVEEKFFSGSPGQRLRAAPGLFRGLSRAGSDPEEALVRPGWASHAEAKALGPDRRIERPQARGEGQFAREGSARRVVDLRGHALPFGWALPVRADRWLPPPAWLPCRRRPQPRQGRPRGAAAVPRASSALRRQLRLCKGTLVRVGGKIGTLLEDVTEADQPSNEVLVKLGDDEEPVKVGDIEGRA
ncbi:MAG: hypothetical protein IT545_09760 [Rhodobacteraceae bacterium]|nr:hypothetical protein [Paracoccaceae bacterium]